MKGILKEIATRKGLSVSAVKSQAMKTIVAVAKKLKANGYPWRKALSIAAKTFWNLVRQKHDLPTVEEVLSAIGVTVRV